MIGTYLQLGFEHILDPKGYDHILFVIVLCVAYRVADWKKMLMLITAFTIGHTVTLGLAALGKVSVDAGLIETLIPVTIIISALLNIIRQQKDQGYFQILTYGIVLLFGLIHGLGFSNFFKSLVSPDESIVPMLFSFNVGVELGQIVIVTVMFILLYIVVDRLKITTHRKASTVISSICGLLALGLLFGVI